MGRSCRATVFVRHDRGDDGTRFGAVRYWPTCRVAPATALWHNWADRQPLGDGRRQWDVMKNGLYSIHVTLLDGRVGKGSGVILFRDGKILGGDAYLFYTGSYTVKDDTFKGEVLVQRHTSPPRCQSAVRRPDPGRHRRLRHLHRHPRRR